MNREKERGLGGCNTLEYRHRFQANFINNVLGLHSLQKVLCGPGIVGGVRFGLTTPFIGLTKHLMCVCKYGLCVIRVV